MGNLLDTFKQEPTSIKGLKSVVDTILKQLDDADRKDLLDALNDRTIQAVVIAKVLQRRGHKINHQSVTRWRNR